MALLSAGLWRRKEAKQSRFGRAKRPVRMLPRVQFASGSGRQGGEACGSQIKIGCRRGDEGEARLETPMARAGQNKVG
jgi:hypothetical protein